MGHHWKAHIGYVTTDEEEKVASEEEVWEPGSGLGARKFRLGASFQLSSSSRMRTFRACTSRKISQIRR